MGATSWWNNAVEIFGLAEVVRGWFSLSVRSWLSLWLIWAVVLLIGALLCVALHFATRQRPKIEWQVEKTGAPFEMGGSWQHRKFQPEIVGIFIYGKNVSDHNLHQFDGEITLHRSKTKLDLFVQSDQGWAPLSGIDKLEPGAFITLGMNFWQMSPRWEAFQKVMSPDDFLREFGAFTIDLTIDGEKKSWAFDLEYLRQQLQSRQKEIEDQHYNNPIFPRENVKMKDPALNAPN